MTQPCFRVSALLDLTVKWDNDISIRGSKKTGIRDPGLWEETLVQAQVVRIGFGARWPGRTEGTVSLVR